MARGSKIDNANAADKLELRRYFLRKYHDAPLRVIDCCQGNGILWRYLRGEFDVAHYWGLDLKPKKGRLMVDASRVLGQPGWNADVVDIDTYGSPWKIWTAMLPNVMRPTTVFLTIGQWSMGTDTEILLSLGLGVLRIPPGIAIKLHQIARAYLLARSMDHDLRIIEVAQCGHGGTADYLGVRLQP